MRAPPPQLHLQGRGEQAPIKWLSVSLSESLAFPAETAETQKCLSLLSVPLFSHLGHNVGCGLANVYVKRRIGGWHGGGGCSSL